MQISYRATSTCHSGRRRTVQTTWDQELQGCIEPQRTSLYRVRASSQRWSFFQQVGDSHTKPKMEDLDRLRR